MKFSIITPSFNQGVFLRETIESVISQKGDFEIEYFVIDGGSSDKSVEILKEYQEKLKNNSKIKFYWQSKQDKGQADAINIGIKKATGDVFSYINSDDYYLPGTLNIVSSYFKTSRDKLWLVGNCKVSDPKLSWTFTLKHLWPIQISKNALLVFNTINQPSVFLKKSLVQKVGFFNTKLRFAFDYDYWLRCIRHSLPGRVKMNLSVFRIHNQSKGNTSFKGQFLEDMAVVKKYTTNRLIIKIHSIGKKIVEDNYKKLKP